MYYNNLLNYLFCISISNIFNIKFKGTQKKCNTTTKRKGTRLKSK